GDGFLDGRGCGRRAVHRVLQPVHLLDEDRDELTRSALDAEQQDQQVETYGREEALRVALSLDGSVGDGRVLLVGEAEGKRHEVALEVRVGADAEREVGSPACDGGKADGLAVSCGDDHLERLLVVRGVDDLVVEPAPTNDRPGSEGRPGAEETAAAGQPEGGDGGRDDSRPGRAPASP